MWLLTYISDATDVFVRASCGTQVWEAINQAQDAGNDGDPKHRPRFKVEGLKYCQVNETGRMSNRLVGGLTTWLLI